MTPGPTIVVGSVGARPLAVEMIEAVFAMDFASGVVEGAQCARRVCPATDIGIGFMIRYRFEALDSVPVRFGDLCTCRYTRRRGILSCREGHTCDA
jgi:hypothetical protein